MHLLYNNTRDVITSTEKLVTVTDVWDACHSNTRVPKHCAQRTISLPFILSLKKTYRVC